MLEEYLEPLAEVVQAGLSAGRVQEAVLGTSPVAGKTHLAAAAEFRQALRLGASELLLPGGVDKSADGRFVDIAQLVFGQDVVVAAIQIAIVLDGDGPAAGLGVDAQACAHAQPRGHRLVEIAHEDRADVAVDPFFEDGNQESAVLFREHAPLADDLPRRGAGRRRALGRADARSRLNDRDELQKRHALVAEEPIHPLGVVAIAAMHAHQRVEIDAVLLEQFQGSHDLGVGARPTAVDPELVVQVGRSVNRQADEEVVLLEKFAPRVVEPDSIGLERIAHAHSRGRAGRLQFDGAAEEVEPHQRGLASLVGEVDLARFSRLRLDILPQVGFERLLRHVPGFARRVERLFLQIEAVFAGEIADRADRLGDHVQTELGESGWIHGRDSTYSARSSISRSVAWLPRRPSRPWRPWISRSRIVA